MSLLAICSFYMVQEIKLSNETLKNDCWFRKLLHLTMKCNTKQLVIYYLNLK